MTKSVVDIIAKRDGISKSEALQLVKECKDELLDDIQSGFENTDEIIADILGLEPDYVFEILHIS